MSVLIIADSQYGNYHQVTPATLATIAAATMLPGPKTLLCAGNFDLSAVSFTEIDEIISIPGEEYSIGLAESYANLITALKQKFDYYLMAANTFGKNILPRIAAKLDCNQISDIIEIIDPNTFLRPIYAGNAIAKIYSHKLPIAISVRPTAFELVKKVNQAVTINQLPAPAPQNLVEFLNNSKPESSRPDLSNAKIIVAGGRGLENKENFKLIEQLADKLNAAIGASRAAVDAGFIANEYQVGQTGKIVAPELYIAIGISGAIQHLAGIKDAKNIVAINKDPEAPIFEIADYGIVGDLFEIIPELISAI